MTGRGCLPFAEPSLRPGTLVKPDTRPLSFPVAPASLNGLLPVDAPPVELVVAPLDADPQAVAACRAVLSPGECRRADAFHFERDRRRFTVARATLRGGIAERTGLGPESLVIDTDVQGKPFLAHPEKVLHFNISHSGERVVLAFSEDFPLGVDIEDLSHSHRLPPMGETICAPAEWDRIADLPTEIRARHLIRLWTAKESFLKAAGTGFQVDPRRIEVPASVTEGKPAPVEVHWPDNVSLAARFCLYPLPGCETRIGQSGALTVSIG